MMQSLLAALLAAASAPLVVEARNPKKGVSFAGPQACSALEPHTDSSWWYSWSTNTGYDGRWSFCDAAAQVPHPADAARANGMVSPFV